MLPEMLESWETICLAVKREVFDILAEGGLITEELAHRMKMMVGFRNIAVHEYQRLNMNIMKTVLEKHLDDLRLFGQTLLAAQLP